MSGGKEIKGQISSIKNTQKITKAMEMVAASKMKKAQGRMSSARPYAKMIKNVVGHLASAHPEYKHPFLVKRDSVKRVGLIVVSSDRGLCGGLNTNLFKKALKQIDDWNKNSIEVDVCAIGSKAEKFFKKAISIGLSMDHDLAMAKLSLAGILIQKRRKREATTLLNEAKKLDKQKMLSDQIRMMQQQLKRI